MPREKRNTAIHIAFDDQEPLDVANPEKSLLRAILLSALSDLRKQGDLRRRAYEYFINRNEDYIFSFRSICDFLSIDPKKILAVTGISTNPNLQQPGPPSGTSSKPGQKNVDLG